VSSTSDLPGGDLANLVTAARPAGVDEQRRPDARQQLPEPSPSVATVSQHPSEFR
jgi:hypothetical protein